MGRIVKGRERGGVKRPHLAGGDKKMLVKGTGC